MTQLELWKSRIERAEPLNVGIGKRWPSKIAMFTDAYTALSELVPEEEWRNSR